MRRISGQSLRHKLIVITLLASTIAIVAAWGLMFVIEFTTLRSSIVNDLLVKADIVGSQCTAALLFNVPRDAEETLAALRADPDIEYAAIFKGHDELFVQYWRFDVPPGSLQFPLSGKGHHFGLDHVTVFHDIILGGKLIGMVTIRSDLEKLYALLLRHLTAAGIILAIALLVAYVLVSRMQQSITGPVVALVQMMLRISENKDFSLRAPRAGVDELGALANGFNEMLSTIQDRDQKLDAHRRDLERTVSDLQRLTAELQEANRKLRTLDEMKSNFISVASHELRTPLTSIKAFVELMLLKPDMDAERKMKLLGIVNAESDRLTRLINDLLNLSRIESGAMVWRFAPVALDDVIRTSIANLMPLVDDKELRVDVSVQPGLPPVRGDRDRLMQVVTNIVSNAIKFTSPGGSISVSARLDHDPLPQIVVAVSDTGVGIPPKDLGAIFSKFHRSGDQLTSAVEGTGLGLAIAREIVEYHGGKIWAESTYGKGSTFTFTLPLSADATAAADRGTQGRG